MNEWLMRAVVQAAAFFELVPDEVLDPDLAVKELENLSFQATAFHHVGETRSRRAAGGA